MYAVFESGGKQHRVACGDIVQVEKLDGDLGKTLTFDKVLLLAQGDGAEIQLGKPYLTGATVHTEVVGQGRGEKILIVKMKRRKQYRRTQGHRQPYTQLLVVGVDNGAGQKATLSDADKQAKLKNFQSHLKAKGPAMTPKTLGSRKRMAEARAAAHPSGGTAEASSARGHAKTTPKAATETKKAPASKKKTTAKK